MIHAPDLARLRAAGARYRDDNARYVIEQHTLDSVVLPTGQVIGCDPLTVGPELTPFTAAVPPGTYPLRAWVAVLFRDTDDVEWQRRTAALELLIRDAPVARWELALCDDQDPATLGDDEYFGYGVDASTGTLADVAAIRGLAAWEYERLDAVFIPAQIPPAPAAIAAVTDDLTGANVVAVSTGWGDGYYPTFIGYDDAGEVVSFITDFFIVPDEG